VTSFYVLWLWDYFCVVMKPRLALLTVMTRKIWNWYRSMRKKKCHGSYNQDRSKPYLPDISRVLCSLSDMNNMCDPYLGWSNNLPLVDRLTVTDRMIMNGISKGKWAVE
jgi:hypothetical protein